MHRTAAAVLLLGLAVGRADTTNTNTVAVAERAAAPQRIDASSFRLITDRNIFNARRSGAAPFGTRETRRTPRIETVALVGTMESDKGSLAFFDGSTSDFKKALKLSATIVGYTVDNISYTGVKLVNGTNSLDLRVGMALRREDDGEWQISSAGSSDFGSSRGSSSGSSSSTTSPAAATEAAPSAEAGDVLKRMMERRAKEE